MQEYEAILREVSLEIEKFNARLADGFKIDPLDASEPKFQQVVADRPWYEVALTCNASPGVYVLCGHDRNDPSRLGAYVGKSSSGIGARTESWLRPNKATAEYQKGDFITDGPPARCQGN